LIANMTKKTTSNISAIDIAVPANPPNPNKAAIDAMMRNVEPGSA